MAANKKVSFAFQQTKVKHDAADGPWRPSPTEIVKLFAFVEATLVQNATVAGHFPGFAAAAVKATKARKVNKAEIVVEEQSKEDPQVCAVAPQSKSKGPKRGTPPTVLPRVILNHLKQAKEANEEGKGMRE